MSLAVDSAQIADNGLLPNLMESLKEAAQAAGQLASGAKDALLPQVSGPEGKIDGGLVEAAQHGAHGLAWFTTYAECLKELADYAERMQSEGRFGDMEALIVQIGFGEYLS